MAHSRRERRHLVDHAHRVVLHRYCGRRPYGLAVLKALLIVLMLGSAAIWG